MKAVVTTSENAYNHYVKENDLKECKQVSRLSDIKDVIFDGKIEIDGHSNVTDYVKNNIVLTDTATTDANGNYIP